MHGSLKRLWIVFIVLLVVEWVIGKALEREKRRLEREFVAGKIM